MRELQADAIVPTTKRGAMRTCWKPSCASKRRRPARRDGRAGRAAWRRIPDENGLLYARALAWEHRDDIARAEADLRKILVDRTGERRRHSTRWATPWPTAPRRYQEALRTDRPRARGRTGQRRHRRQLRLGALSPGAATTRRWSNCAAPGRWPRTRKSPRTWARCCGRWAKHEEARRFFEEARQARP